MKSMSILRKLWASVRNLMSPFSKRSFSRTIYYLETSAVNILADKFDDDFEFLKFFQRALKIDFCISSVVIWEVLLNSSDTRKDRLIYWCQFACADYLLKSPSELLVDYLRAGLPKNDKKEFWYDRASSTQIASVWKKIHGRIDRTIPVDVKELSDRTRPLRDLSKMHKSLLEAMTDSGKDGYEKDAFHRCMGDLLTNLSWSKELSREKERQFKTALIYVFFMVCLGIDLDNSPVREFWSPIGIAANEPFERLDFLIQNYPKFFVRGPIAEMTLMVEQQTTVSNSANRGMLLDSLHTIYCYYSDNFVAEDSHFQELHEAKIDKLFDGIIPASKFVTMLELTREKFVQHYTKKS